MLGAFALVGVEDRAVSSREHRQAIRKTGEKGPAGGELGMIKGRDLLVAIGASICCRVIRPSVSSTHSNSSMETKIKTFDAVEMSRRLRENTSRKLNAMSREERRACLRARPASGFCARRQARPPATAR